MGGSIDDPRRYGKEWEVRFQDILKRVHDFREEYLSQQAEFGLKIKGVEDEFGRQLDKAFENLVGMTKAILGCTDEELDAVVLDIHASDVLGLVKKTLAEFHTLRMDADAVLHEQSEYSQLVTAKENGYFSLDNELNQTLSSLRMERVAVQESIVTYAIQRQDALKEIGNIEKTFREYDNLSAWDKMFKSDPRGGYNDRAHQSRVHADNIWTKQSDLLVLGKIMENIFEEVGKLQWGLREEYHESQKRQNRVVDAKEAAAEIFSKVYDMEVALTSPEISICVEDAARHVLKLVSVSVKIVDEDPEVKDFKKVIISEIEHRFGSEKAAELSKEKKYIEI